MKIKIFHPSSTGIVLFYHINWIRSTRFIYLSRLGCVVPSFTRYAYLSHIFKCSTCRCVCPPSLFTLIWWTDVSNYASIGTPL